MKKTNLMQEAIIEARELKEAAEKSVKQQLMEELSPLIKKTLESQFSSLLKEQDASFGIEEEPTNSPSLDDSPANNSLPVTPASPISAVSDTAGGEPVAVEPAQELPVAPTEDGHTVNIPLPDASGQITVSISDLFTKPSEVIQAVNALGAAETPEVAHEPEAPAAVEPEAAPTAPEIEGEQPAPLMESTVRNKFLALVELFAEKEKEAKITEAVAENIQFGLIALIEEGQDLLEKGLIESRDLVLCKKRAEKIQNSLQEKLNTVNEQNSYNEESNQKPDGETMAIKKTLKDLFEETEVTFDGLDTNKPVKDAAAKQNKVNSQDPGTKDIGEKSKDGEWDKEGAKGAASDSASEKAALEEAIALFKAALSLNEEDEEGSVIDSDAGASDEGAAEGGSDEEFDIEALLKDFEKQLEDHGISLDSLDVDVAGEKGGEEFDLSFDLDDEGQVEPAGEAGEAGEGSDEEAHALVLAEALDAIKKAKTTIAESRKEKSELELYNHKTVCLNKLLMREAISTQEEKKAAVVALDRGTTLKEVTEIYNRIVAHKLQEGKVARNGKATAGTENGTISEGVKREPASVLAEGVDPIAERMQYLAKMK